MNITQPVSKRAFVNYLVKNEVIASNYAEVAFAASFPRGHRNFKSRQDACTELITGPDAPKNPVQAYTSAGGPVIERLLNLQFHEGLRETVIPSLETPVATANRASDDTATHTSTGRGRPAGTKNRDKATIEAERAEKVRHQAARVALGLPSRGRFTAEQRTQVDNWLAANPIVPVVATPVVSTPDTTEAPAS